MEKLQEFMGKVVKVEESQEKDDHYKLTGNTVRIVTIELPQLDAYVSNTMKLRSESLKMGDAVRIVALSVPALTESEIAIAVSQQPDSQ